MTGALLGCAQKQGLATLDSFDAMVAHVQAAPALRAVAHERGRQRADRPPRRQALGLKAD